MSLPALQLDAPGSAATVAGDWITAAEGALRLGKNRAAFIRQCKDKLAGEGMAVFMPSPDGNGGRAQWFVRRSLDARLDVSGFDRIPDAFWTFTEKQQRQAWSRADCAEQFRRAAAENRGRPQKRWAPVLIARLKADHPDLNGISIRSLQRWSAAYNEVADLCDLAGNNHGGVRSGEGGRRRPCRISASG